MILLVGFKDVYFVYGCAWTVINKHIWWFMNIIRLLRWSNVQWLSSGKLTIKGASSPAGLCIAWESESDRVFEWALSTSALSNGGVYCVWGWKATSWWRARTQLLCNNIVFTAQEVTTCRLHKIHVQVIKNDLYCRPNVHFGCLWTILMLHLFGCLWTVLLYPANVNRCRYLQGNAWWPMLRLYPILMPAPCL